MNYQALMAENARLRAENEDLRKANAALQSPAYTAAVDEQVFRFLDLPKDIRLIVYEFALCPGTITLRINTSKERGALRLYWDRRYSSAAQATYGSTQLFAVCKQIKDESLGLYLTRNVFIWPYYDSSIRKLFDAQDANAIIYGPHACKLLRNLSITFSYRDSDPHAVAKVWSESISGEDEAAMHDAGLRAFLTLGPLGAHIVSKNTMNLFWHELVAPIKVHSNLKRLSVDVKDAYCDTGCCRMWHVAEAELFGGSKWTTQPERVEISGASEEEASEPLAVSVEWYMAATYVEFVGPGTEDGGNAGADENNGDDDVEDEEGEAA